MHPNRMFVITAVVGSCLLISLPAASQIHQTQPVLVVNGTGAPVPTVAQGTTNVAGTVTLSSGSTVNVGNTPSVNVANTPTVSIAPGAGVSVTNPLNGQNNAAPLATLEAIQPYEDSCSFTHQGFDSGSCSLQRVPAGKRLVIQEFDATGVLDQGVKPLSVGLCTVQGCALFHFFPAIFMGTNSFTPEDNFATHQATSLYVGSNALPLCGVVLSNIAQTFFYSCQISGFLVDVP